MESPDRFARDLTVKLTGHDFLKSLGIALIPATAPDFFTEDTPTAVLVRQVLGAIAQFEKTSLVACRSSHPSSQATAHIEMGQDFASKLDRATLRSNRVRLLPSGGFKRRI